MEYSYNQNRDGVVFANAKDLNASFKDLGVICDAIRYKSVPLAIETLESTISGDMPILYKKHNKHMGARHELGGKKGRWPIKCAKLVLKVLVNASANARNKGLEPDAMFVVHASANKTMIARRGPSKGALFITGGPVGYVTPRHSDLEFARVELGIAMKDEKKLSPSTVSNIDYIMKQQPKKPAVKKEAPKKGEKEKKSLITKVPEKKEEKKTEAKPAEQKKEEKKPMIAKVPEQKAEEKKAEAKPAQATNEVKQ